MDSTIAAISTPAGVGARAILRISGDKALRVANALFHSETTPLTRLGGFRTVAGWIRTEEATLPARAYVFRAPRSYTRQDLVEFHIPGHPLAAGMVLEAMVAAGARLAEPGEFTLRAFLTGRIDLSAAEAVADIISAATDAQLRAAEANAAGALHALCAAWSETAAEALTEVEASIDMAEEDLELISPPVLAARLGALAAEMTKAAEQAVRPPTAADIPRIAMAGPPNVGKSSLLNVLTGLDRAIVSATAGATRDVLTAPLMLEGGREVLLMDLAGLAAPEHRVAAAADDAAQVALKTADIAVAVLDIRDEPTAVFERIVAARPARTLVVAANKADLLDRAAILARLATLAGRIGREPVAVSATTGEGLALLKKQLTDLLALETPRTASGVAMHDRQRRAVRSAGAIFSACAARSEGLSHVSDQAEFLALEIREGLAQLGTVSGDTISEEVLSRIFARFCVGK